MSRFVWNIRLEGNAYVTTDSILHDLKDMEIRYGTPCRRIDCDRIEEELRSRYPEILWVSARQSGTCLEIKVKENQVIGKLPEPQDEPRDLVADVSGTITSILVRRGRAQVNAGDRVEQGQLLVSGRIPITNDSEEEVACQYVHADADIRICTKQVWKQRLEHMIPSRSYTGRTRHGLHIRIGGLDLLFLAPKGGSKDLWEMTELQNQVVLLRDFYLPLWINPISAREYQNYQRKRTNSEMIVLRNQINDQIVQNLMEKGVQIIENNVKMLDKNTCWEISGQLTLDMPAGVGQNMEQEEEQRKADECN